MGSWILFAGLMVGLVAPQETPDQEPIQLLARADQEFAKHNYDQAQVLYQQSAENARTSDDKQVLVESLAQVARCHSLKKELVEGRKILAEAQNLADKQEPLGWSRVLGVRGIFEREEGDRAQAKNTFAQMFDYCVNHGLHRRALDAIHHIAIVAPVEEQVMWAHKGIALAEKMDDDPWLAVLWNNLGATFEDKKEYPAMVIAYQKARLYHHRGGDPQKQLIADWAYGHGLRLAGEWDRAEPLLRATLRWSLERNQQNPTEQNAEWVAWCQKDLGQLLASLEKHQQALGFLHKAHQGLVKAGIKEWWPKEEQVLKKIITELEGHEANPDPTR